MPKVVDQRERRAAIADAVLAVVARGGLEAATLRTVADEAGLAIGSVRHYFDGHQELIIFAAQELDRRIGERVWAHAERILALLGTAGSRDERRRLSEELLAEWLPLDEQRQREAVLRHTFTMAARTRAELLPQARALRESMAAVVRKLVETARTNGGLAADLNVDLEAARLCALLDGLSLQGIGAAPGPLRQVLRHHLDALP
ncbi:AcrR family transcriptional regulator [Actinoplanes octamycinicus]|uniref:AcrR family transcriptional regulator n=1 Tax=Actinoplanes octamycinicus TaxID=135948 RepID=A0A7W7H2U3_9ACTN|nr:TetR/AcrR family transcriptional regulator [Actinoplanes octamycinicus]MBB4742961.1 AcrR family transcriptional regulator [Actinoplanes octamycinicus]